MPDLVISQLAIYPVKSMRQLRVEKTAIDMGGLQHDRRWMVVDSNGRMVTQRQQSRLCLVQPALTAGGIRLSAAGLTQLEVPVPATRDVTPVTVWNDTCNALDAGEEAARWLSDFLHVDCRLVYFPHDEVRAVDSTYAGVSDRTAFSDGFPVLVISQASLDDLNSRMKDAIPMARFRPNIVIANSEPFAEDAWKRLRIGELTMRLVKPCSRCIIPSIDIETAQRGEEPTRTLIGYRKRDKKIFFGQNAIIDGEGEIKTGMPVEVIE